MTGRDLFAFPEDRAGREHRAGAKAAALEHGRAHAHHRPGLDDTAFELGGVSNACVVLDHRGQIFGAVDDRVVLDVGAVADPDGRFVGPQDCAEPDAGVRADLDLTDEDRGGRDVGVRVDLRPVPGKFEFQGSL